MLKSVSPELSFRYFERRLIKLLNLPSLLVSLILIISKVYYNIFINEFSIIEYIKIISDFSAIVLATLTFFIVYYNLKQIEELKKQREFSKQPILENNCIKICTKSK